VPLHIFPVAGGASYTDDFADPRSGGRSHAGNDLLAAEGTPILAVDDGDARYGTDPLGGNIVNLRAPDGTRYYYAHLSAFEGVNRPVRASEVLGYVGKTGNAANGPPHLHFEMHPGGGDAVDPYTSLRAAAIVSTSGAASSSGGLWKLAALGVAGYFAWANRKTLERWIGRL
jgi:murein DD-endopeptidase MepM/ murein hydrolase activator NlpD